MRRAEREEEENAGIYDRGSMFERGEERQGPAANPPIIRQEDPARGVPATELAAGRNQPLSLTDEKLVAAWDAQGNPQVARVVNNRQQEQFRPPTPEEWEALKDRGQFVRGGLSAVAPDPAAVAPPADDGLPWGKIVLGAVVVGGLAYANWDTLKGWYDSLGKEKGEDEVVE